MTEIGGSMGPLYGVMFTEFAEKIDGVDNIDAAAFSHMLHAGLEGIQSIGSAKVGDKTLLDTLVPAVEAFDEANAAGKALPRHSKLWLQPPKRPRFHDQSGGQDRARQPSWRKIAGCSGCRGDIMRDHSQGAWRGRARTIAVKQYRHAGRSDASSRRWACQFSGRQVSAECKQKHCIARQPGR